LIEQVRAASLGAPTSLVRALWDDFWPYILILAGWLAWRYILKPLWAGEPALPIAESGEEMVRAAAWIPAAASNLTAAVW
jgi:hypothetical protein